MGRFGKILKEAYGDMFESVVFDSGLSPLNEGVALAFSNPANKLIFDNVISGGSTAKAGDDFVAALTDLMNTVQDGKGNPYFTDNPSQSIGNVAETIKNILQDSSGVETAKKIMLSYEKVVDPRTRIVRNVPQVNVTSLRELQRVVGNLGGPITDKNIIKQIIKNGGDFQFLLGGGINSSAPSSLDEMIRQGTDVCREGGKNRYLRYINGLKSATSVMMAATGIGSGYSFFKGIYPKSIADIESLYKCHINGQKYALSSPVEVVVDGSKGGRSVKSEVVDPKWKPPMKDDGTIDVSKPRMKDISEAQADASFRWISAIIKLGEGKAYFENPEYFNALLVEDMHKFEKYFNDLAGNDDLMTYMVNSIGGSPGDWDEMCKTKAGHIYFSILGGSEGNAKDVLQDCIMKFRDTLRYRMVDGLLQRFKGANMFSYYVFTLSGEESGDTGYLLNHYPPGESKWTESPVSNFIRVTDRTRTLGDRARQMLGSFGGEKIGGKNGSALRF